MPRPFRFGVNLFNLGTREEWRAKCRRVEDLGYDVLLVPDHLGMPAPFSALAAAAEATERPRLGTFVLNAGLWNPVLLARETATCDALTDGRLELGLGTGYVQVEHDTAGLPFGSPRERVDHLERTIATVRRLLEDPEHLPRAARGTCPPLVLGGNGDRVLRLAARHADVAAFTGAVQVPGDPGDPGGGMRLLGADALEQRVAAYRRFEAEARAGSDAGAGGEAGAGAELNFLVQQVWVTDDRRAKARELLEHAPHFTEDQLLEHPALLAGSVKEIAEQVRAHRERFGFSYFVVLEPYLEAFAPVLEELRGT
ncbi:TIGR03621 family F420-dependent LLM class oxidoreductase [Streptomyces sp. B1866]|uniref:TIGR03621 family F420-dependent LLM class oxidoreductase n=1 Tax=Streptomyces sp. B1866 TaxID=3075431 RepID=UPI002891BBED|nr:TIGR03621 family F420-dependent LLM class oxidoreductase [Streptomyces sp. B1866]MDT3400006.1 TIGR03621 family F420-dependent LLM class oxidoreductase [Streptomyces sp. B1866]